MKWRWWRTRAEKEVAILVYLLKVGEAPGRAIAKGADIDRVSIYLLLFAMTQRGLVKTRPDPADLPRLDVLGAQRLLYSIDKAGQRRLDKEARKLSTEAVWGLLGAPWPCPRGST